MATVKLQGDPCNTNGDLPAIGAVAPDFNLVDGDLNDLGLNDFAGKKKIIYIVPSLDTPVCQTSTKKFNEHASSHDDTVMIIVSADLPFAMGRFCGVENVKNVKTLSMMRSRNFAKDYGVLLIDGPLAGITTRALLVLDADNKVIHTELVADITQEPDYDAALAALA